jgi:hypothetical protein
VPAAAGRVELGREVSEDGRVLAHVWAWVGTTVRKRVDAGSSEEVVLDELQIRVEAQGLVIDVTVAGVRADHEPGDA